MINDQDIPALYRKLKPFIAKDRWQTGATGQSTTGSPTVSAHALYGAAHTGTLDRSQAPWVASDIAAAINTHNTVGDPHSQYVHISNARTISASHNFAHATVGFTSPDADSYFDLGRARAGYVGFADYAGFAHRDVATSTGYALLQYFDGENHINAPSGRNIHHRINNTDAMVMSSTELTVNSVNTVRTNSFTSGFTGNGFRLDNGVLTAGKTTAEMDDLIVRGRMRVYELLVQQIRATNGSIFVSSTGKVKTATGSGPYSIETDATHGFLVNDLIRAQRFTGNGVYQSNLQVTAVADTTHFTATLSSGDAPAAGMEFVRLGNTTDTTRQNSIYMSADDTYNPFIDIVTGVNSFAAFGSTATRKGRIGNLQGLFSVAGELGIFVGDGTGITNKYLRISNLTQESHNIPTKMYDSGGNLFMQMDTGGLNYYVQSASSFADNTSVLFRRPDGTKILRLVGVNDFGAHTGSLGVETGSSNSELRLVGAAPSGYFSRVIIQNNVGASSSQWIFQRLSDGTARANFASHLVVDLNIGVGVSGNPTYKMQVTGGGATGLAVDGASRFGQGGQWGAVDAPSIGWIGFGANFYYSGNQAKYRATNYASQMFCSADIGFNTAGSGSADGNITWSQRMIISNAGNVGIGVGSPLAQLHVANSARIGISGHGLVQMSAGDASNIGYYEWYNPAGNRIAYMGFGATNLTLALESSSNLRVTGGQMWVGNSTDIGFGSKIQTDGNIWANGAITSASYWQVAAASVPAAASGYCRVTLRSSDNALVAVMPSGNVRVLATN